MTSHLKHSAGIDLTRLGIWLRDPRAKDQLLAIFIALYPLAIGSLQSTPPGYDLPLPTWLWDLLTGLGVASIILLSRYWSIPPKSGNTVLLWLLASFTGAFLPALWSIATDLDHLALLRSLPAGVVSNFGLLMLFTILRTSFSEYGKSNGQLSAAVRQLQQRRSGLNEKISLQTSQLRQGITETLDPHLQELKKLLQRLDSEAASSRILSLIDNLVRPTSEQLREGGQAEVGLSAIDEASLSRSQKLLDAILQRLSVASMFSPYLPVIFSLIFFTEAMSLLADWKGISFLIGFLVLTFALFSAIAQLLKHLELPQLLLQVLNVLVGLGFGWLFVSLGQLFELPDLDGFLGFVGLGITLAYTFSGFVSIFVAGRQLTNARLDEVAKSLSRLVGELQLQMAVTRDQLSQVLHGDLQAKLQAALIRLTKSAQPSEDEIVQILNDLEGSKKLIAGEGESLGGIERLEALAGLWDGICEVTLTIDDKARALLASSSRTGLVVGEIVGERVVNAVKHSSADEIDILISATAGQLEIITRNQNYPSQAKLQKSSGGGSAYLDAVCLNWSLEIEGGDTVFQCRIALD